MAGLNDAIGRSSWTEGAAKYIFLVADAPPHGERFSSGSKSYKTGSPLGITLEQIGEMLREEAIKLKLVKIGSNLGEMVSEFENAIDVFEAVDLSSSSALASSIDAILVRDIECSRDKTSL